MQKRQRKKDEVHKKKPKKNQTTQHKTKKPHHTGKSADQRTYYTLKLLTLAKR